jgi:hypothetical protein
MIAPPRVGCVLAGALLPGELTPFASGSFLGCPVCTVVSLFGMSHIPREDRYA